MKFLHVMHRHPMPVQQRGGLNTQLHSHLPLRRNDDAGHAHPRHGARYATYISVPSRRSGALRTNAHKHGALPQHMDLKSAARTYGTQNGKGKHYKKIENSEANTALPHKKNPPRNPVAKTITIAAGRTDHNTGRKSRKGARRNLVTEPARTWEAASGTGSRDACQCIILQEHCIKIHHGTTAKRHPHGGPAPDYGPCSRCRRKPGNDARNPGGTVTDYSYKPDLSGLIEDH